MKIKTSIKILSLLILLLAFSGCNRNKIKIGDISNIKYKGVDGNTLILEADALVINPGLFKLRIKEIDAVISVNNIKMGRITKIDKVIIPAKTKQRHKIKMYLDVTNMAGGIMAMIQMLGKKRNMFKIEGTIKVKYFLFTRTIEFKQRGRKRIPTKKPVSSPQ